VKKKWAEKENGETLYEKKKKATKNTRTEVKVVAGGVMQGGYTHSKVVKKKEKKKSAGVSSG